MDTKARSLGKKIFFILNVTLWLAFFLTLVVAISPAATYLMKPLLLKEEVRQADVIVVLADGGPPSLALGSAHSLIQGAHLYFEGKSRKILFAGGAKTGIAESALLAQNARGLRIPAEDILTETRSQSLHEQVVEVKKVLAAHRWKSIILVSSCLRLKRALQAFELAGLKVYPVSAVPYASVAKDPFTRMIFCRQMLGEYAGFVYYKIRGWI